MYLRMVIWVLLSLTWSVDAAAQQACVVTVLIKGNSCTMVPVKAETECTSFKYHVETDRDVKVQTPKASQASTACPKGTCMVDGGESDVMALKMLSTNGTLVGCTPGTAAPTVRGGDGGKPKPRAVEQPTPSLLKAIAATDLPAAHGPGAAGAVQVVGEEPFVQVQVEAQFQGQPTGADQIMDELLRTVAAVAMERAQARAAQRLIDAAAQALCGEGRAAVRRETWKRTCGVLDHLTPATLGTAAEAIRQALVRDVGEWIVNNAPLSSERDRTYLVDVFTETLVPLLTRPGDATRDDLLRLLNALVTHEWEGSRADAVNLAFYVVRVCGKQADATDCDVGAVIDAALQVKCKGDQTLCDTLKSKRLRIEAMASRLALVLAKRPLKSTELKRSLRDLVDVALALVEELAPQLAADAQQALTRAVASRVAAEAAVKLGPTPKNDAALKKLQEDVARMQAAIKHAAQLQSSRLVLVAMLSDDAFSFALHVGDLLEGEQLSPKVHALLNAVLTYARTYKQDLPEGEDPAERRKEIVEALVTATTDRTQRADDWIVSLGVDVGFDLFGYQWIDGDGGVVVPQLMMPLGVFIQRGPEDCTPGFHVGAFFLDVAQYATYQSDGTTTEPRWDTAIAVGGQVGMILGSIADPFVIGLDARYAPSLFSNTTSSEPVSGGTLRFGVFANYYVPLFDMN